MKVGPYVASTLRDLGIRLDTRGLIPLADARKRLRAAKIFAHGKSHIIPNQVSRPTDADYLWGSLLSLADAEEFVREASRLVWKASPRGFDNIAPYERYGGAIVPWLATFIDENGTLSPTPACVIACLSVIADVRALEELLSIRKTNGTNMLDVIRAWLGAHGKAGWRALADLAMDGHARANEIVLAEAKRSPAAVQRALGAAIGPAKAKALLSNRGAPSKLTEAAILEVLDAAASSTNDHPMPWPARGASVGHFEPHAMRLIAARSKKSDDWGVLFEVVQGDLLAGPRDSIRWPMTIQYYRYGSRVPTGGCYLEDSRPIGMHRVLPRGFAHEAFAVPPSFEGIKVVGPKGTKPLELTDALVKKLGLEPGRACSDRIEDWPSVIAVRARLAKVPSAFWIDPEVLARKVLLIADPIIVVETDAFEHVSGPAFGGRGPDARRPSASKTFRSLATALVSRAEKSFTAGIANVDWRAQSGRGKRAAPRR